jgi:hypothetical protein
VTVAKQSGLQLKGSLKHHLLATEVDFSPRLELCAASIAVHLLAHAIPDGPGAAVVVA